MCLGKTTLKNSSLHLYKLYHFTKRYHRKFIQFLKPAMFISFKTRLKSCFLSFEYFCAITFAHSFLTSYRALFWGKKKTVLWHQFWKTKILKILLTPPFFLSCDCFSYTYTAHVFRLSDILYDAPNITGIPVHFISVTRFSYNFMGLLLQALMVCKYSRCQPVFFIFWKLIKYFQVLV